MLQGRLQASSPPPPLPPPTPPPPHSSSSSSSYSAATTHTVSATPPSAPNPLMSAIGPTTTGSSSSATFFYVAGGGESGMPTKAASFFGSHEHTRLTRRNPARMNPVSVSEPATANRPGTTTSADTSLSSTASEAPHVLDGKIPSKAFERLGATKTTLVMTQGERFGTDALVSDAKRNLVHPFSQDPVMAAVVQHHHEHHQLQQQRRSPAKRLGSQVRRGSEGRTGIHSRITRGPLLPVSAASLDNDKVDKHDSDPDLSDSDRPFYTFNERDGTGACDTSQDPEHDASPDGVTPPRERLSSFCPPMLMGENGYLFIATYTPLLGIRWKRRFFELFGPILACYETSTSTLKALTRFTLTPTTEVRASSFFRGREWVMEVKQCAWHEDPLPRAVRRRKGMRKSKASEVRGKSLGGSASIVGVNDGLGCGERWYLSANSQEHLALWLAGFRATLDRICKAYKRKDQFLRKKDPLPTRALSLRASSAAVVGPPKCAGSSSPPACPVSVETVSAGDASIEREALARSSTSTLSSTSVNATANSNNGDMDATAGAELGTPATVAPEKPSIPQHLIHHHPPMSSDPTVARLLASASTPSSPVVGARTTPVETAEEGVSVLKIGRVGESRIGGKACLVEVSPSVDTCNGGSNRGPVMPARRKSRASSGDEGKQQPSHGHPTASALSPIINVTTPTPTSSAHGSLASITVAASPTNRSAEGITVDQRAVDSSVLLDPPDGHSAPSSLAPPSERRRTMETLLRGVSWFEDISVEVDVDGQVAGEEEERADQESHDSEEEVTKTWSDFGDEDERELRTPVPGNIQGRVPKVAVDRSIAPDNEGESPATSMSGTVADRGSELARAVAPYCARLPPMRPSTAEPWTATASRRLSGASPPLPPPSSTLPDTPPVPCGPIPSLSPLLSSPPHTRRSSAPASPDALHIKANRHQQEGFGDGCPKLPSADKTMKDKVGCRITPRPAADSAVEMRRSCFFASDEERFSGSRRETETSPTEKVTARGPVRKGQVPSRSSSPSAPDPSSSFLSPPSEGRGPSRLKPSSAARTIPVCSRSPHSALTNSIDTLIQTLQTSQPSSVPSTPGPVASSSEPAQIAPVTTATPRTKRPKPVIRRSMPSVYANNLAPRPVRRVGRRVDRINVTVKLVDGETHPNKGSGADQRQRQYRHLHNHYDQTAGRREVVHKPKEKAGDSRSLKHLRKPQSRRVPVNLVGSERDREGDGVHNDETEGGTFCHHHYHQHQHHHHYPSPSSPSGRLTSAGHSRGRATSNTPAFTTTNVRSASPLPDTRKAMANARIATALQTVPAPPPLGSVPVSPYGLSDMGGDEDSFPTSYDHAADCSSPSRSSSTEIPYCFLNTRRDDNRHRYSGYGLEEDEVLVLELDVGTSSSSRRADLVSPEALELRNVGL